MLGFPQLDGKDPVRRKHVSIAEVTLVLQVFVRVSQSVKVDSVCCILSKGVPFIPVVMQHGAIEGVLLWQRCALCAIRRCTLCATKGARCARQGDARALCAHYIHHYNQQRTSPLRLGSANIYIRLCTGLRIPLTYDLLPNIHA